jgi:hypothetical protein
MIEHFVQRLERRFDVREVDNPACVTPHITPHVNLTAKRMSVEAGAFVAWWHIGQPVGGFEREFLENIH